MSITLNGITARECWEGYKKGINDRGPFVLKPYLVPWGDADAFADGIMGNVSQTGDTIFFTPRHACPENPTLYASSVEIDYVGEANPTNDSRPNFQMARVTVNYGVLTWDQQPSDDPGGVHGFPNEDSPGQPHLRTIQEIDSGGEFTTVKQGAWVFTTDQKPMDSPLGIWVPQSTVRFNRKHVPYLPHRTVHSLLGKINDDTFLGEPRGQMRFSSCQTRREANSDGTRTQDVMLTFSWRGYDWNKYIHPDSLTFEEVSKPGDSSVRPYEYADFKPLLRIM